MCSELKILEHNVKKRIASFGSISSNFASKAKNVQILNMSRFTPFGDQTFRALICKIKLAEISRTYLNKHFGVKFISIGQFVCK